MNKVIEADFFPRESDPEFSRTGSIARSGLGEKRRILIVDNDRESSRLVKILLERTGRYLVLEENDATRAHYGYDYYPYDYYGFGGYGYYGGPGYGYYDGRGYGHRYGSRSRHLRRLRSQ